MSTLVLYGRPDCHLCDEARDEIASLHAELPPFDVREVDIESDPELFKAYLERIPVVEVDGMTVSELELDAAAVRVALRRPDV